MSIMVNLLNKQKISKNNGVYQHSISKIQYTPYGMDRYAILELLYWILKRGDKQILEKVAKTDLFQILWTELADNKWNNIVHAKLYNIFLQSIMSQNSILLKSLMHGKIDVQKFCEGQYRKKHIFTYLGERKVEFKNGNIGPFLRLIMLLDDLVEVSVVKTRDGQEIKSHEIIQNVFKNKESWEKFKEEKLEKVSQVWKYHQLGDELGDGFIKLEKQWESYIPQTPLLKETPFLFPDNNSLVSSQVSMFFLNELPMHIERDTSFIMVDEEDIKEIIIDRALRGCNKQGCSNIYCRDNKEFWQKGIKKEADVYTLLKNYEFIQSYVPCKKIEINSDDEEKDNNEEDEEDIKSNKSKLSKSDTSSDYHKKSNFHKEAQLSKSQLIENEDQELENEEKEKKNEEENKHDHDKQ